MSLKSAWSFKAQRFSSIGICRNHHVIFFHFFPSTRMTEVLTLQISIYR
jgi:hypothetical protein